MPKPLSRRKFIRASMTGMAIAGTAGFASCMTSKSGASGGITPKFLAAYQSSPNGREHCAGCIHFLKPNACEIVAGKISPDGWCRFYKARSRA